MANLTNIFNHFLCSLSAEDLDLLWPHLTTSGLRPGETLHRELEQISHVYFPSAGVISLVVGLSEGDFVEAGMCGVNGVVGAGSALDGKLALNRAVVQMGGSAERIRADVLKNLARQSHSLHRDLFRHEQAISAQTQQVAACNAKHDLESRLARWLLQARDLVGSNRIELTQEYLAQMLGVRRTSVTLIAQRFQSEGLIKYSRGRIELLHVHALREAACECYPAINRLYKVLIDWVPSTPSMEAERAVA